MRWTTWAALGCAAMAAACSNSTTNITNVFVGSDGGDADVTVGEARDAAAEGGSASDAGGDAAVELDGAADAEQPDGGACTFANPLDGSAPSDGCYAKAERGQIQGVVGPVCDGLCGSTEYLCPAGVVPIGGGDCVLGGSFTDGDALCCTARTCTRWSAGDSLCASGRPVARSCTDDANGLTVAPPQDCFPVTGKLGRFYCCTQ